MFFSEMFLTWECPQGYPKKPLICLGKFDCGKVCVDKPNQK